MKCSKCKALMEKDTTWERESYYKVSNLIKFSCKECHHTGTKYEIATNSLIVDFLCSVNNRLLNKLGLLLAYDYSYTEFFVLERPYNKIN